MFTLNTGAITKMKRIYIVLIIISIITLLYLIWGGYPRISGTVVDDETGKPIEGAIVFVEWTITKGIGHTSTHIYKNFETVSDKDGVFHLPGVWRPFVDRPTLIIYKRGYIAWRNDFRFPGFKRRHAFKWKNGTTYLMERFVEGHYLHGKHTSFIRLGVRLGSSELRMLSKAIKWEGLLRAKESRLYEKIMLRMGKSITNDNEINKKVLQELYLSGKENQNE